MNDLSGVVVVVFQLHPYDRLRRRHIVSPDAFSAEKWCTKQDFLCIQKECTMDNRTIIILRARFSLHEYNKCLSRLVGF